MIAYRWLALTLSTLVILGCTATPATRQQLPAPIPGAAEYRSEDIRIRLVGALQAGDADTLVEAPGWSEHILAIDNTGNEPLTIHNVKLLNLDGRYLDSAATYEQITAPPDLAYDVASDVAKSAAGVAAGQVIPYGGTIVGIISGAISASTHESEGNAKREFDLRKLKRVELAPGGRVTGSAFLPDVTNAKALVVDYGQGNAKERIEITLLRS